MKRIPMSATYFEERIKPMNGICRMFRIAIVAGLFQLIGYCAEPMWGLKGSTVLSCEYEGRTGVSNTITFCQIQSGPAVAPDNAVVAGIYLVEPPRPSNLKWYRIDVTHYQSTTT